MSARWRTPACHPRTAVRSPQIDPVHSSLGRVNGTSARACGAQRCRRNSSPDAAGLPEVEFGDPQAVAAPRASLDVHSIQEHRRVSALRQHRHRRQRAEAKGGFRIRLLARHVDRRRQARFLSRKAGAIGKGRKTPQQDAFACWGAAERYGGPSLNYGAIGRRPHFDALRRTRRDPDHCGNRRYQQSHRNTVHFNSPEPNQASVVFGRAQDARGYPGLIVPRNVKSIRPIKARHRGIRPLPCGD